MVKIMKEVILCAGPVNTPKILLLSGVGPAEHLRKMGVSIDLLRCMGASYLAVLHESELFSCVAWERVA